ncbi:hypothetical protein R1flu_017624 [Riccia fluitans]|uniref:Uncharacterized protein n=1 Tax=Riccia fluitans TaxID=41844 RepID=A0ABD1ZET9_9MARC
MLATYRLDSGINPSLTSGFSSSTCSGRSRIVASRASAGFTGNGGVLGGEQALRQQRARLRWELRSVSQCVCNTSLTAAHCDNGRQLFDSAIGDLHSLSEYTANAGAIVVQLWSGGTDRVWERRVLTTRGEPPQQKGELHSKGQNTE